MTRAMFATVIARMALVDLSRYTSRVFIDVDPTMWYGPAVAWAFEKGIVQGVGGNRFNPNGNISRQDMVLMINRFVNVWELDLVNVGDPGPFPDQSAISSYAVSAVNAMRSFGIVQGRDDGSFDPLGNSTRAEVSTVLFRLVRSAIIEAVARHEAAKVDD